MPDSVSFKYINNLKLIKYMEGAKCKKCRWTVAFSVTLISLFKILHVNFEQDNLFDNVE